MLWWETERAWLVWPGVMEVERRRLLPVEMLQFVLEKEQNPEE